MPNSSVYVYYSGATDITGKKLVEDLDITGGNKMPTGTKKLVIGWGCKTDASKTFPASTKVLNHPDKIRANRNKLGTLTVLKNAGVKVADFVAADNVISALANTNSSMKLPLVGRTNFHQGGKGFWLCITKGQVQQAITEGAQYFQNYMDIADEFRLHIFQGDLICAQKKARRDNMETAFVEQHKEKIVAVATKNNVTLDNATMDYVLGRLAKGQPHPDMIIRSNTRGWKFSQLNLNNVNNDLRNVAVAALAAAGLDFGAVDCCILADGTAAVIELNSGPGLQGTSYDAYRAKFAAAIDAVMAPPQPAAQPAAAAAAVATTVSAAAAAKKAPKKAAEAAKNKASLQARMAAMQSMVEAVESDEEAALLDTIFARLAAGQQG